MSRSPLLLLNLIPALCFCLPVFGQLHAEFSSDKTGGCRPLIIHFTNGTAGASPNATYEWDLGNGNSSHLASPEAVYVNEGNYTVTLTVKDGNQSSKVTHTITVFEPPTVDFSASPGITCINIPVAFASTATAGSGAIISYLWDFGDGITLNSSDPPTHTYQHEGHATVSLTVTNSNGCSSNLEKKDLIKILPQVTAAWSADKQVLCNVTDPIQFTNNSTGTAPLTYLWDFGDGHTSTLTNPVYSFMQKGTYTVKLTTTSADGCSATFTQTNPLNVANYHTDFDLPANGCSGASIAAIDKSIPATDSRVWQIDGTNAGTDSSQTIILPGPGVHTVKLTGVFGACSQSITKQITVVPTPVLTDFDIVVQGKCGAPATVDFTDHTAGAVSWDWNFNYDPTDPQPNIIHQGPSTSWQFFTDYRNYSVQLTVKNADGCSSSLVKTVMVQPPVVNIYEVNSPGESSCNTPITKTYAILHPENLQSWEWDFGDGATSTDLSPTHTFTAVGQYTTVLKYTTKDGCTGVANALYTIISKPLSLDFSLANTTVCANSNILLDAPSLYSSDALGWSFDFGDGPYGPFYPQHVYTTPGVYTVTLRAFNAGCNATVTKPNYITVLPPVGTYTGFDNTCDGLRNVVTFHFTPGSATQLVWDFGDGTTQTTDGSISSLQHTYSASGYYPMTVTGGNTYCAVSGSSQVSVFMKQHPTLTTDQSAICPDGSLHVSVSNYDLNPWTGIEYNNYTLNFQYGDSTNFQGQVTTPYYTSWANTFIGDLSNFQGGESGIRLITTSIHFGCNDTTNIIPLNVKGVAAGYSIVSDHLCFQSPVVLKDTSKVSAGNSILSWRWDFGDGQTSSQSGTVSHSYANPGSYLVKLTVQDGSGCSSSSSSTVTQVVVNGPKASFTPSATDVRLNTTVTFNNSTQDFGSHPNWSWDFGDHTSSADPNPTHQY
ncbi:MAG TPA: PKD domain-containing protein, partial [Puia sp.]